MKEMTIDQLVISRLSNRLGVLESQLIEAQTYNEILIEQNKQLQEQLEALKEKEQGEGNVEPENKEGD